MRLSIIIPAYQAETTLRRCLDSVLSQSFRDVQVILVDDASTDGTHALMEEYCQRDHRVQMLTLQKNEGLSQARNHGLHKAHGEYVTFIDSDDALGKDTLQAVMEIINVHPDYDFVEYPIYEHYGNIRRQHLLQFPRREYKSIEDYWLEGHAYQHSYACNKIYRTELFKGLAFPKGEKFEDVAMLPLLLSRCHLWATISVGLYLYYDNPTGITAKADGEALRQLLDNHLRIIPKICNAEYYAHVLNIALDVYENTGIVPRLPDKPYNNTTKLRLKHLIGLKGLCQVNKLAHRFYRKTGR